MFDRSKFLAVLVGMALLSHLPIAGAQQPDPDSPRYKAVVALSDFLIGSGDDALKDFLDHRVSPTLLASIGRESLASALDELRADFSGARLAGARPEGPSGAYIMFSNNKSISFEMEASPPHRFVRIGSIDGGGKAPPSTAPYCAAPQQASTAETQWDAERVLGVLTVAPDANTARAMSLATRLRIEGRVVTGVLSDSPADRAGIRKGDVLLQLGNNRLYSRDGLNDFLKTASPGTVPVLLKRSGTKTEETVQISLSSDDLPEPGTGIRWQYSGLGQLDQALAAANEQGRRLLVGLSGSEECCAFSRFEAPSVAVSLAGDDISRLADRYVTLIIRRPHAYWFLKLVSGFDENANFGAIPDGLKLPSGELLPIPSVFVLDGDREVLDQVALADGNAASLLRQALERNSVE